MDDECTDCSNQVQFSVYVRYIYKDSVQKCYEVTEDVGGFAEIKRTDAEYFM